VVGILVHASAASTARGPTRARLRVHPLRPVRPTSMGVGARRRPDRPLPPPPRRPAPAAARAYSNARRRGADRTARLRRDRHYRAATPPGGMGGVRPLLRVDARRLLLRQGRPRPVRLSRRPRGDPDRGRGEVPRRRGRRARRVGSTRRTGGRGRDVLPGGRRQAAVRRTRVAQQRHPLARRRAPWHQLRRRGRRCSRPAACHPVRVGGARARLARVAAEGTCGTDRASGRRRLPRGHLRRHQDRVLAPPRVPGGRVRPMGTAGAGVGSSFSLR